MSQKNRRTQPDEAQGLAELSVRTKTPVDKLPLQRKTDAGREEGLRTAAKEKLLAMAGLTAKQVATELRPAADDTATPKHPDTKAKHELSPEQTWLNAFKTRFDSLPQLHEGIEWSDVEKSLNANPEQLRKLQALDAKGHEMNVFGEKDGNIVFRSAQTDITKIAPEHRTIMYDEKAQQDYPQYKVNGNAVDIAKSMGVELADKELYEQFRVRDGWVWLKTDAATRETGHAFFGHGTGLYGSDVVVHDAGGSFCAALRVKKV